MGLGAVALGLAAVAVLVWAGFLINAGRVRPSRAEETPSNLQPYLTDDELESTRLNKVLVAALISSAVLAIVVPIYYLTETDRQAAAAEGFHERNIEEGLELYIEFQCVNCHSEGGVGGAVAFVEKRSNLETSWNVPALDDVFYRYDRDEVRYWIVFGRAGSPMPAAGLEGGGAMTSQQVDQVLDYLESIQIPQQETLTQTNGKVDEALRRIETADETIATRIETQEEEIAEIRASLVAYGATASIPVEVKQILAGPGTCTARSAAVVSLPCDAAATDSDRDGLSDVAEVRLEELFGRAADGIGELAGTSDLEVSLDPADAFTTTDAAGDRVPDLDQVVEARQNLLTVMLGLAVFARNPEPFLERSQAGLEFLQRAAAERKYDIDFEALAADAFNGDVEMARRASGLYNAYCARCHTAGYSAGVQFEQEPGSGAFGPGLRDGRSIVQFPSFDDHVDFIIKGSQNAVAYGVNGAGRGWMPGFGFTLTREDIELIVRIERALQ